jgi:hypothetical protein
MGWDGMGWDGVKAGNGCRTESKQSQCSGLRGQQQQLVESALLQTDALFQH